MLGFYNPDHTLAKVLQYDWKNCQKPQPINNRNELCARCGSLELRKQNCFKSLVCLISFMYRCHDNPIDVVTASGLL